MLYYNFIQATLDGPNELSGDPQDAQLDPLETEAQGEDVFLLPANATFIAPPEAAENEMQVFDEEAEIWSIVEDYRGTVHYDVDGNEFTIIELDELVPAANTTEAPPTDPAFKQPHWNGSIWEEAGLIYHERGPIETKAQVDVITAVEIDALGEQKAKTLKIVAGDGACSEWDTFIAARDALVSEGDQFVIDNSLV